MAGGPAVLGLVYFATVKFVGYSIAARFLSSRYAASPNSLLVGGARTVLGIAAGVGAAALAAGIDIDVPSVGGTSC